MNEEVENQNKQYSTDSTGAFKGFLQRMINERIYRAKIIQSCWIIFTFGVLGWQVQQFGPSLLDLQTIARANLEEASWFLTMWMIGMLVGSSLCGLIFDRMDKYLFVFFTQISMALVVAAIPWMSNVPMMFAAQFGRGVLTGISDPGLQAFLFFLWGPDCKSLQQGLHLAAASGFFLSPLATAPFLMQTEDVNVSNSSANISLLIQPYDTCNPMCNLTNANIAGSHNFSQTLAPENPSTSYMDVPQNITKSTPLVTQQSRLYIAYFITAGLEIVVAIPYLLYFFFIRKGTSKDNQNTKYRIEKMQTRSLRGKPLALVLIIVAGFMSLYRCLESTFGAFLPALLVKQMKWTKENGSYASSALFSTFTLGRFVGIFLVRFVSPKKIVFGHSLTLLISFIGLFVSVKTEWSAGIWLFTLTAGYGLSIAYPSAILWTDEWLIAMSGKVSSFFITVASVFSMINPIILGVLLEETPMWFFYFMVGESALMFALFFAMLFLTRYIYKHYGKAYKDETDKTVENGVEMASFLQE